MNAATDQFVQGAETGSTAGSRTTPDSAPASAPCAPPAAQVIIADAHDRQKLLGGSDIAAVLGLSPWKTRVDLWADKIKPRSDAPRKRVFTRGIRWESVVAEMLTEELVGKGHKVEVVGANRRFRDAENPVFAAEIDYEIRLDDDADIVNVELKTVHPFKSKEWGDGIDDIPVWYTAQAMWGLGVAPGQRRRCLVAALFGADELRSYEIARDDDIIAGMRTQASDFWVNHVLTGIAPAAVNLEDVAKLYPREARPGLLADSRLRDLYEDLKALRADAKASVARQDAIETEIKAAMKDCEQLLAEDPISGERRTLCTWKTRAQSRMDTTALREAHPEIAREFTRKSESRTFIVK